MPIFKYSEIKMKSTLLFTTNTLRKRWLKSVGYPITPCTIIYIPNLLFLIPDTRHHRRNIQLWGDPAEECEPSWRSEEARSEERRCHRHLLRKQIWIHSVRNSCHVRGSCQRPHQHYVFERFDLFFWGFCTPWVLVKQKAVIRIT